MLVTKQKVMKRFWYATVRVDDIREGPKPFTLLGEKIVLFLDGEGKPAALEDRCRHRTAQLSKGWCKNGNIVCGYHGWEYNSDGKLVAIPQSSEGMAVPEAYAKVFHAKERYGYAWVALEEPLEDIPEIPEDSDPGYRRIFQFYEVWNCGALRMMENSFDSAHFSFVHKGTFGILDRPKPERYEIRETAQGFDADTYVQVANPLRAARITGTTDPLTYRTMRNAWYMPFCRRLDVEYPSGIRHIVFNCCTPIDDSSIQLVQLLYRNDTEEDCTSQELIDWDAEVVAEDRLMLESTDPDAVVDISRKVEMHMPSDRPGLLMRKRLVQLLEDHGEREVARSAI